MPEQRKYIRLSHRSIRVEQVIRMLFGKEEFVEASCMDVSEGGLGIRSKVELEYGDHMYALLNFKTDDTSTDNVLLPVEGSVVHTRKDGEFTVSGLRFDDPQPRIREFLEATSA